MAEAKRKCEVCKVRLSSRLINKRIKTANSPLFLTDAFAICAPCLAHWNENRSVFTWEAWDQWLLDYTVTRVCERLICLNMNGLDVADL